MVARASGQGDECGGGHARRGAAFGLAAADLGGKGPAGRDEDADQTGGEHCFGHRLLVLVHRFRHGDDGSGQRGAGTGGGCGNDDAHAAFDLHQGGDIEDDAVECSSVKQLTRVQHLLKTPALMMEHPVLVARAGDAAGDGFPQDADDGSHSVDDFVFHEAPAGALVVNRELPERGIPVAVAVEHFLAASEGHSHVFPRGDGEDG